ncbi:MFS transporter [Oceanispirochaeta crateris]|uniref:MFS transporter n=1 Tax=Oceanispirochaeta crateris TaxID=2518645 RepID=A0A5C1QGV4_9SPIO|nr:MFS transporter [Oceanispirochaeta crateris]QEN07343.1 MFS transporter [Oceanispirochaeta crateris]
MKHKMARNINLDYSFTFLSNLNLLHALWMIYLSLKGFTLLELGLLEGIFHMTSFLMEVPTGAVADLWGRKHSRILGRLFFIFSLIFLWTSDSFLFQSIGFILTAMSYNLESGAGEALVYDTLVYLEKESAYMGTRGKKELIYQLASIMAFLCGGYFATKNYNIVFTITMIFAFLSLINAFLMVEPLGIKAVKTEDKRLIFSIFQSLAHHSRSSILVIKKEPKIAFLIIFSEGIFVFATCLFFYLQTWWKSVGITELTMGYTFAIQGLVAGLTAMAAPKLDKKIGEQRLLLFLPLLLLFSLWGVALTSFKSLFFIFTGGFEGILIVTVSDYINKLIPGEFRATILSYQSMVFSLLMILLFPLLGWIGDAYSLLLSFYIIAITASILYIIYLLTTLYKGMKIKQA